MARNNLYSTLIIILYYNMVFNVYDKLLGIKIYLFLLQIYKTGKNLLDGST